MAGLFVPAAFTEWAGKFVCEGKMVYMSWQKSYYCYTSTLESYDLGSRVFLTFFKMFLLPCIGVCVLLWFGVYKLIEYLIADRAEN